MPEGHVVHRQARALSRAFRGEAVVVDSPQGRFAEGAAAVTGRDVRRVDAFGKHLFIGFADDRWIHVHLGLFGKWRMGSGEAPDVVGEVRLRLRTDTAFAELRGPTVCEVLTGDEKKTAVRRIGPDPIRRDAVPAEAWARVSRSAAPVGGLLMDQRVFAGVGNIYRSEVLFRHGIDPARPGTSIDAAEFDAIWADLVALMKIGQRRGQIVVVRPEDDHGAPSYRAGRPRTYVYRRAGEACRICGSPVLTTELEGRNLFWCPSCQS